MDCLFCKFGRGELPCLKVFENDAALVLMDIARDVDGHMLAIPKAHAESILDCDAASLHGVMDAIQAVSRHCVEKCGYEGVNLLNASGMSAGQSMPHFHIHMIPRRADDGVDAWPAFAGAKRDIQEVYQALKME